MIMKQCGISQIWSRSQQSYVRHSRKTPKSMEGKVKKITHPIRKVTAKIRRKSDDSVVATFNQTIDSTRLSTVFAEYTFTLTNPYTIQSGDRIMIEYGGPASVQLEIWTVDKIDGSNTARIRYTTGYIF